MKLFYTSFLLLTMMAASPAHVAAQSVPDKDNTLNLPPLADLIDSAVKHSASVQYRNLEISVRESGLRSQQNFWYRNMGLQADTRYGTYDNFLTNTTSQSTSLLNSTSIQFNYGFGVYMKFPLVDLLDRKNQIKQAKTQIEEARMLAEAQQDDIRQIVIKQYQDVLLRSRLLNIKAHNLSTARVNLDMTEKEFRNGLVPVTEYARITEIATRAETDYETGKTEYITSKLLLENLIGFKL